MSGSEVVLKSEPTVVHESDCPEERWSDGERVGVRWRTLLSGDRTPTSSLTVGVAEIPPGDAPVRPHHHEPVEAYYILEGEGFVEVAGREHAVRAGSAVFIPGNAEHVVRNTGSVALRLLYVFPVDAFDQVEYRFPQP
jgi:mannose-6-phosphate isomerase-like protein (cupin superfamily)